MQNFFDGTFREDILLGNAFVFGDDVKKSLRVCLLCSTSPEKHSIEKHSILPWWRGILPPGAQNPYRPLPEPFLYARKIVWGQTVAYVLRFWKLLKERLPQSLHEGLVVFSCLEARPQTFDALA